MNNTEKVAALVRLRQYLTSDELIALQNVKEQASLANGWFTPASIETAIQNICQYFLHETLLLLLAGGLSPTGDEGSPYCGIFRAA